MRLVDLGCDDMFKFENLFIDMTELNLNIYTYEIVVEYVPLARIDRSVN